MNELYERYELLKKYEDYIKVIREAIEELEDGIALLELKTMADIEKAKAEKRKDRRSFEVEKFFDSLYETCGIPRE